MTDKSQELIVVEQLPVITERLAALSEEIKDRISSALSLECTEETVKTVKVLRADLNKDFAEFESRRKAVKTAVMEPYDRFEGVFKQYITEPFKDGDAQLKAKIDSVESELKGRKRNDLAVYFDEYSQSRGLAGLVSMDRYNPNVTLTATLTALKKEAKAYIDRVCDDLALIETQKEHVAEILVEYWRSLNVSQAITAVSERYKAIEEQAARQAELEARKAAEAEATKRIEAVIPAPLEPPVVTPIVEDDPMRTLAFKVTAPLSMLRELKKFLDDGGYQYE